MRNKMLEDQIYISNLYDYYSLLLTEKQRVYFEEYYFHNLTLKEISDNHCISRNAVHKNIKETVLKLFEYEKKLKLYEKGKKILKIIEEFDDELKKKLDDLI